MPRVNVTVTEEQHRLLLELSQLQGGSASGFLRQQLDLSTPFLRAAVPLLRRAAEETEVLRDEAEQLLEEPLRRLREAGVNLQGDLLDRVNGTDCGGSPTASGSERGRGRRAA